MTTTTLPDRYEVVFGEIKELPELGYYAHEIAGILHEKLMEYLFTHRLGRARSEFLFQLPLSEDATRNRRPDLSYFSYERWPQSLPLAYKANAIPIVPNLVVEVLSPTDLADEVLAKAFEYLRGGVEVVIIVSPLAQTILTFTNSTIARLVRLGEQLDCPELLPGFAVNTDELFPPKLTERPNS